MKHNFRRLAAIALTAATVFSFSAVAMSVASGAEGSGAGSGKTPIAAYSLKNNDLTDKTGKNGPVVLDPEDEANPDASRNDADRLLPTSHSGRAWAKEDGVKLANGFFKLPDTIFANVPVEDIDGLTFSMTVTKTASAWPENEWAEILFSLSDEDVADNASKAREASFFSSYNGNVGTGKYYYNSANSQLGAWMDGSLGGSLGHDTKHTVTVTYDVKTNTAVMYCDGMLAGTSTGTPYEVKAKLTAEQIKSLVSLIVGRPNGGNWGMWGFGTYSDVTIYSTALSAAEVKVLATEGWEAVKDAAESKAPVTEKAWPTLNGKGDGTFTAAAFNVDGLPISIRIDWMGLQGVRTIDLNKDGPGKDGTEKLSAALAAKGWDILTVSENFAYNEQLGSSLKDTYTEIYKNDEAVPESVDLDSRFKVEDNKLVYVPFKTDGLSLFYKNTLKADQKTAAPWNEHYSPDQSVTGDYKLPMGNGADGLITKGFRHFEVVVADGLTIDVYTFHMDADDSASDRAARDSQLKQLADYIVGTKTKNPIIIMGDTNCRYTRDDVIGSLIGVLNAEDNLYARDAWVDTAKDGKYPVLGSPTLSEEIVDKIIFVNNSESDYQIFLNTYSADWIMDGETKLSDHPAVVAEFTYQKTENTAEPTTPDTSDPTPDTSAPTTTPDTTPATTEPGGTEQPPQTGDFDGIGIWVAISVICLAGLGVIVFSKRTGKE